MRVPDRVPHKGLDAQGIVTGAEVAWNLTTAPLVEHAVRRGEGLLAKDGPLVVRTGKHTGRSANDTTTDQFTTVLPVGTAADVERILRLLQPSVPDDEWALIAHEGMSGPGEDDTFTNSPSRAWWIRPSMPA